VINFSVYYPPQSRKHVGFPFFSEKPDRLARLETFFKQEGIAYKEPNPATKDKLLLAHSQQYVDHVESLSKMSLLKATYKNLTSPRIQWYTRVSPGSYEASLYAVGAVCNAVEDVLSGTNIHRFCAIRPPGHHAGYCKGEGFCLFNNVAIGALHALNLGAQRVAIVDFDRHHGNGTQEIVSIFGENRIFFASSYQAGCKYRSEDDEKNQPRNTVLAPIPHHAEYRQVEYEYKSKVLKPLEDFEPDVLFISAGFDMHVSDPLTNIKMQSADYYTLTRLLAQTAHDVCCGRIVSVLEGGYHLEALKECVENHIDALR
jgi:acetoin utilization deacetylase AcuC-like enzyme